MLERPQWADSLLEDTVPPEKPGSLSHFFDEMSQGRHELRGKALTTVIESDSSIADLVAQQGALTPILRANRYILQKAVDSLAAEGMTFADFDVAGGPNGDRYVDFVFICWQSGRTSLGTCGDTSSVKTIAASSFSSLVSPYLELADSTRIQEGATILPQRIRPAPPGQPCPEEGCFVFVRHRWMVSAVAAHEYGHFLINLLKISGDLPNYDDGGCCSGHISTESRYGIMNGSMTPPVLMMSGIMRRKLGWIDPQVIPFPTSFPFNDTLTISTSYEDGQECFALVQTADSTQYFLLEGRKANLPDQVYNSVQPPDEGCCYKTRDVGDGLLIAHIQEGGKCCFPQQLSGSLCNDAPPLLDVEVATGRFDPSTGSPDPGAGLTRLDYDSRKGNCGGTLASDGPATGRAGDLFRPTSGGSELFANAFTPFTNPNTNLYGSASNPVYRQSVYSGISLYDIQWVGEDSTQIQVKLRIDDPVATAPVVGGADTLRTDMTVGGVLQLTADLVVPPNVSLTIKEGSVVVAGAQDDRLGGGADTNRVELIGLGPVDVQGTVANSASFMSSRSQEFKDQEFRSWAAEAGTAAPGDWDAIHLDYEGCEASGYGFLACLQPISSIKYANIKQANFGIAIENLCGPELSNLTFSEIVGDRHIYLDSTDVFIPYAYFPSGVCNDTLEVRAARWDLLPGTRVVAADSSLNDAWVGVPNKVDLIPQGQLFALGIAGDSVHIRSEGQDSFNADDWGGLYLDGDAAAGSRLEYVSLGYATNPLFLFYPQGLTTVKNSRIHHFADTGIWVYGAGSGVASDPGGLIESCTVERGSGLGEELGLTGIRLDRASELRVLSNKIDLAGLQSGTTTAAIDAYFGAAFCAGSSGQTDSLILRKNWVLGPGTGLAEPGSRSGIKLGSICGSNERRILLEENYVEKFKTAGLEFSQSSGIQVNCNTVLDVRRAVDLFGRWAGADPARFKSNWLQVKEGNLQVVRTDDNENTVLGSDPIQSDRGDNGLMAEQVNVKFIRENDPEAGDLLDARLNYWFLWNQSTNQEDFIDDGIGEGYQIATRIKPSPVDVPWFPIREDTTTVAYCR
jgi:hypothetical protein